MQKIYMCIDLKSFYASVECRERGLNPLDTNLVVADTSRTEKTICLAVTPSLKEYGISGRARLFEVISTVKEVNKNRKSKIKGEFTSKSCFASELQKDPTLELDFIAAPPRMRLYMKYSTDIYNIYLKYIAPEDILVYSIDEVFCDITNYLNLYKLTPKQLVTKIILDVYKTTGITATAGLGTNMYLAKIAMDITAKHMKPNLYGVRIAYLTEQKYKETLWNHKPLTDFWRVGKGYAKKLEQNGMYTMGDVARMSINNEDFLFKLFGINAELLIDHAWGYEPCTIKEAKSYKPQSKSLCSGQVLHEPYTCEKTRLIVKEMTDLLVLDIVKKHLMTNQLILTIGYDVECLTNPKIALKYDGPITLDHYGREVPVHAHGTANIDHHTSSTKIIMSSVMKLFDRIINPLLLVRRINISANNLVDESYKEPTKIEQIDLFTNFEQKEEKESQNKKREKEERKVQHAIIDIQEKYGKNSILKGMNFEEGATTKERNQEVGGHKG